MCFSSETIYDGISSAFKFQADSFVKLHFVIVMGAFMKDIHTSGHLIFFLFCLYWKLWVFFRLQSRLAVSKLYLRHLAKCLRYNLETAKRDCSLKNTHSFQYKQKRKKIKCPDVWMSFIKAPITITKWSLTNESAWNLKAELIPS